MHELSIANAIVGEVRDAMVANRVSAVSDITVKIGRLSGVVPDSLLFGWDIVRQGTVLAETSLIVEDDPVVVWCPVGDHALTLEGMVFRCDDHNCSTPEVLSGERLEIVRFSVGETAESTDRDISDPACTERNSTERNSTEAAT